MAFCGHLRFTIFLYLLLIIYLNNVLGFDEFGMEFHPSSHLVLRYYIEKYCIIISTPGHEFVTHLDHVW